jgi:adenylate cyclase
MLNALTSSVPSSVDAKNFRLLKSLIEMYAAPNSRYVNYYGPPRTITTIPYHQALQLRNGKVGDRQYDLKGKAVFVGLSEAFIRFFRRQTGYLSAG